MESKLARKPKYDIILLSALIIIGVIFHFYGINAIYEKFHSLAQGFELQWYLLALHIVYKLFCFVLIVQFFICLCYYLKAKNKRAILTYIVFIVLSTSSIRFLPYPKPVYLYEFESFVAGVKDNIDEQQFRDWINSTLSNIADNDGIDIEMNELSFLSKSGIMACDGVVRKYDSKYYEVMLIWGSALPGHYGLLVSNDPRKIDYFKKEKDVVEVYEDVWAWTENK